MAEVLNSQPDESEDGGTILADGGVECPAGLLRSRLAFRQEQLADGQVATVGRGGQAFRDRRIGIRRGGDPFLVAAAPVGLELAAGEDGEGVGVQVVEELAGGLAGLFGLEEDINL